MGGGLGFPCIVMNTTNISSLALKLLFNLLTRLTFMLEEALVHLGLIKPTEDVHWADYHPYPTNYVLSMDGTRSPSSPLVPAPVEVKTTTLIKNSLPVVEYGNFIRRFQVHEDDDDDDVICVVCLNNIRKSDEIRELRNCSHLFHRECLDTWINKDQLPCPLCRSLL